MDSFKFLVHNTNCDVFALSETWLSSETALNFHEFNIIRLDRDDSYGGVLLGIKKSHSFYRISLPSFLGVEVAACQARIKGKDLCIASVYIPHRDKVRRHHLTDITEVLPEPRLIVGDFNSHGTGWGEPYDDNLSTVIYDLCDDFNLTILNTGEPTRIPKPPARPSALDLALCSRSLALDCTWKTIQDPEGSDHLPITITITNGRDNPKIDIAYDLTRNIDWQKFAETVSAGIDAAEELPPLEEYNFLARLIHDCALQAQTKRGSSTTVRQRPPTPWWDKECSELYIAKSTAFKDFRKHGTIDRFRHYAALERKLKNLLRAKKRGYWRRFVDGLSKDTAMSTLWRVARRMRNHVPSNESSEYSNRWILDFAKKVCPDSVPAQKTYRDASGSEQEAPFSMVELSLALLSCNNTAPGSDGVKFNLLKNLPDPAKRRLLNLFNKFLELNIVPHDWRQVKVIAIQKPNKPASDHNSYRPIAMLSCIRKLLEKMILHRLDNWIETIGLVSDTQFGFRRGKGTNDCLALLSTELQLAFAQKKQTASVFLDIKGAFDSVSIEVLLAKLHNHGLSPILNNFLYNLLSEKHMYFSYGDCTTSRISYMGLPQGSCLSPLLYNFYVNDIDTCLAEGCTLRQLADDGVVSVTGTTAIDLQGPLQDTLDNLSAWALGLGIEFSTEKTEMMVFSRKHQPAQVKLQLLGKTITQALSFKYLGVWFDSKCTWRKHIEYQKQKCQQRINFLRTITGTWWGAHPRDLIRLYQTTILSVMEYGSFCFRSAANTHLKKLETIQYRCLRIALGCMQSTHTMSLEVLAGVLPLKNRFSELSYRFLIRSEIQNPLVIANFEKLLQLNPQSKFMCLYYDYMSQEISPSSLTPNRVAFQDFCCSSINFDLSMKQETHGIPDHFRSTIFPSIFHSKYRHINSERMFFTDGSKINESVGFGVYNEHYSASFKLKNPCSVYVAELAAIYYALGIIDSLSSDHYFIFTDSLSAIEALRSMKPVKHSSFFLAKIRESLSALIERNFMITLAWVPSHCSIPGNEKADELAKVGAVEGTLYDRVITFNDFFTIARQQALVNWQHT